MPPTSSAAPAAGRGRRALPDGVESAAQYGPDITTKVADTVLGHHIPVHRSTLLVMELCGMKVSTGFAAGLRSKAARLLESVPARGAGPAGRRSRRARR